MQNDQRIRTSLGLFTGLFLLAGSAQAGGDNCVTVASGNWSTPGTWDCGGAVGPPGASDFVTITNGFTVLLDVDAIVNNLAVDAGGDLNVAASAMGLSLTWDEPGGDLSNATTDLAGDLTITVNNGEDFLVGAVDGGFNLTLNGNGQATLAGNIGATTRLNSLTTDAGGSVLVDTPTVNEVRTTGDMIFNNAVVIEGNSLINTTMGSLTFNSTLDRGAGGSQLGLTSSTGLFFNGQVGVTTPLSSLQVGGPTTINTDMVLVSSLHRYGGPVVIGSSALFTGGTFNFENTVNDDGNGGTASAVTINASGNSLIDVVGATSPIDSLTTDAAGATRLRGNITTNGIQDYGDELTLDDSVTLTSTMGGNIVMRENITGPHDLILNTDGLTYFFEPFPTTGKIVNVASITTDAGGATRFERDNTLMLDSATATTFNDSVQIGPGCDCIFNQNGTGNVVFNSDVSQLSSGPHNLTVNDVSGQTIFNGSVTLDNLTTNDGAGADSTVMGTGPISTSGSQTYNDPMLLTTDITLSSSGGGNINVGDVDGAQSLLINTSGLTDFRGNIGFVTRLSSIVTDVAGNNRFTNPVDFIQVDGSAASVFGGETVLFASTDVIIDQAGSGDVVFDGPINLASGSPHRLTINDVSGQTVFNGNVDVGRLTTNDGAGADSVLVNGVTINTDQGGADNGLMTFNDPVIASGNVIFSEEDAGRIVFNNTLNGAFGRGLPDTIRINSDNEVTLNTVGDVFPPSSLMTDAGGSMLLNGDITTDSILRFGDPVVVAADVNLMNFNAINVVFDDTLDDDGDDMTGSAVTLSAQTGSVFLNATGSVSPLDSLTINSFARLSGDVVTGGDQTYVTDTFINESLQLSGDNIVFGNNINQGGDPSTGLTINAATSVSITGAVGNVAAPLGFLRSNSSAPIGLDVVEITTNGDQQYVGPVTLDNTATFSGSFITFDDSVGLGSNDLTLNTTAAGSMAAGPVSGSGGLTKDGSGDFNLAAANTFSGGLAHNGGTLLIDGSTAAASAVSVTSATLGGNGTANGPVVLTGGTLTPGSSPGILATGDLMFDTNSTFVAEVDGVFAGTEHDQVQVTGTVTLDDAEFQLSGNYVPSGQLDVIVLIVNDGADAISGIFQGLPEGAFVNNNGPMTLSYAGGDGNDVVLIDDEAVFADSFENMN